MLTPPKSKFQIGDTVQVKEVPHYFGKIGFMEYRGKEWGGYHYRIHLQEGQYLTFAEKSLKKYRPKKPMHQKV